MDTRLKSQTYVKLYITIVLISSHKLELQIAVVYKRLISQCMRVFRRWQEFRRDRAHQ